MRGYGWLAVASVAALSACSGGGGAGGAVVPPQTLPASMANSTDDAVRAVQCLIPPSTGVWGQVVHALPNNLTISLCKGATGTFDAVENFEGNITVTVQDRRILTVSADVERNHVYPTEGGLKNAWFTVTPLAVGTTTLLVRDKKGNSDTVTVTVVPCATPTPAPTATPTPSRIVPPTPSPTASPSPTPTPAATPSPTPTPVPTATPSPAPTATLRW